MKWLGLALALATLALSLSGPAAASAKTCSSRTVHAIIGGKQKCLSRGEYCEAAYNRQYRKYGFVCDEYQGFYRLEPKG
jgi:hypothetical protein